MAGLEFGDFLNKMSGETNSRKKRPVPVEETYIPERQQPVKEKVRSTPVAEEIRTPKREKPMNRIDEEFRDRAYDYSQSVIKLVRDNFKSVEERTLMFESLINAINYYMGRSSTTVVNNSVASVQESSPMFGSAPVINENEWQKMGSPMDSTGMRDLTGQTVTQPAPTGNYKTSLNLGLKIGADGKQEADLSGITATDINEMKILAGMIGPEADNKTRELNAAKQAVAQEVADKANMRD